jgi:hypothetical protein
MDSYYFNFLCLSGFGDLFYWGVDYCTTPIQQLYNNPSHEGGPQYVGPTLM